MNLSLRIRNKKLEIMKKLSFIILLGLITSVSSFAQFKFGVRGGVNFNNISLNQSANEPIQIRYEKGMGFHFGATSQLQISSFFIQPELIFSTVKHDVTVDDIREGGLPEIGKQSFTKMDIPLVIGFKSGNFKIGAGPVGTMMLGSKSELLDRYEMKKKTATWGYQLGAGFDFERFNIELRYEGNLSGLGSGIKIGNTIYDFDERTNQVILSTAFYF
jgi:hypothetical protein